MTPLPSRLRASAQVMRTLDAVSLRPSSLALIDRERATSIASELEEAAQALEAQREDRREVLRILYEAHRKTNPSPSLAAISAAIQHLQAVEDATSAQVAQEGGGVAIPAAELLEALDDMARQYCLTNGNATSSGALSTNAHVLRLLAKAARFRIARESGRMVIGYWPENDPKLAPGVATDGGGDAKD